MSRITLTALLPSVSATTSSYADVDAQEPTKRLGTTSVCAWDRAKSGHGNLVTGFNQSNKDPFTHGGIETVAFRIDTCLVSEPAGSVGDSGARLLPPGVTIVHTQESPRGLWELHAQLGSGWGAVCVTLLEAQAAGRQPRNGCFRLVGLPDPTIPPPPGRTGFLEPRHAGYATGPPPWDTYQGSSSQTWVFGAVSLAVRQVEVRFDSGDTEVMVPIHSPRFQVASFFVVEGPRSAGTLIARSDVGVVDRQRFPAEPSVGPGVLA